MSRSVRIALARPIRRLFDYLAPEQTEVQAGQRVQVPFGRQTCVGLVVDPRATAPAGISLKPIRSVLEDWPALPAETLALLTWAASYYQHPLGECLFHALPPALRRGRPAQRRQQAHWQVCADSDGGLPGNARRQQALLHWLRAQTGPRSTADILHKGFSRAQLKGLEDKGLIRQVQAGAGLDAAVSESEQGTLPALSAAQQAAFEQLPAPAEGFRASLLYGITGSGKTEIYLHYLQHYLPENGQALILVPEINLTPQTVARFRACQGDRIAVWHSALNDSERLDTWLRVREGEPVVVIGTRSAVMLPFTDLKTIVVDEEHDSSYKQGEGFRYSGRDLAVYRASLNRCPVILGSATPSLESLHNAHCGKYRLVRLEERAGPALPPDIRLLDIRSRPLEGGLSAPALQAIDDCLKAGNQALVFVNRRGYAPVMMCFDCGHMLECPRCDTRLTYHRRDRAMRCHHCDFQMAASDHCPSCSSEAFKPIGQGTERTEDVLAERFADTPVIRVDRDSTQRRGSIQAIIEEVRSGEPCILVGTQMLAKGHDFPKVTLVVVVNADGGLFSVDFRAPEQMTQTLLQVSGRAGRGQVPGRVLIQTCHSDHPLLRGLSVGHYLPLAEQLLAERESGRFPPFRAMAMVRAEAATMADSLAFLDQARPHLEDPGIELWGPLPAVMARRADRHRAQLVLQSTSRGRLNQRLAQLCQVLEDKRLPGGLRWQVDVDPLETG
ncbi:MAG: primosomal protein N' [Marinobacter sp.]|uniref:primosomal protein N' n=1 Tax=Marinobacter sp. TaxID=50741 RepID=UPI00299E8663|nr:primosomal protein N' [Marinobacter sp.]MDX1634960.1 primosomal protein N' [Marinobacter sp.]